MAGAHALAWHVAENLKKSDNYTPHLDQADIIFVNDYCYWAWWLAWLNFGTITSVRTNVDDVSSNPCPLCIVKNSLFVKDTRISDSFKECAFTNATGFKQVPLAAKGAMFCTLQMRFFEPYLSVRPWNAFIEHISNTINIRPNS